LIVGRTWWKSCLQKTGTDPIRKWRS